jgi:hypothetical protein
MGEAQLIHFIDCVRSAALSLDYARSSSFFVVRFNSARFRFHGTKEKILICLQVPLYNQRCQIALACVVVHACFHSRVCGAHSAPLGQPPIHNSCAVNLVQVWHVGRIERMGVKGFIAKASLPN